MIKKGRDISAYASLSGYPLNVFSLLQATGISDIKCYAAASIRPQCIGRGAWLSEMSVAL